MKVTVARGIQVVHAGERHSDGRTVDVPDELAGKWLRAGWVSEAVSDETPDEEGLDDAESDAQGARGADRRDAQRRASGSGRAGTRRG